MADQLLNVEQMARALYGVPADSSPTKAQTNSVAAMCRAGKLDATKCGRRWLIRVKWPDDAARKTISMEAKSKRVRPVPDRVWKIPRPVE